MLSTKFAHKRGRRLSGCSGELLQLIGDFRDSRCCAGFVPIAARSAANTDSTDDFVASANGHSARSSDRILNVRSRRVGDPGLAGRIRSPLKRERRVGFASAEVHGVWARAVNVLLYLNHASAVDNGNRHAKAICAALIESVVRNGHGDIERK